MYKFSKKKYIFFGKVRENEGFLKNKKKNVCYHKILHKNTNFFLLHFVTIQ